MATRITANGHLALPKHVRETLQLSPGDAVEFGMNDNGEVVLRKAPAESAHGQPVHPRLEAQMRRRAEELIALLRGLD
jgi:AbrB family looped-hinge helix DNA binding protein